MYLLVMIRSSTLNLQEILLNDSIRSQQIEMSLLLDFHFQMLLDQNMSE